MVAWNFREWSSPGKSCAGTSELRQFMLSALCSGSCDVVIVLWENEKSCQGRFWLHT